MGTRYPGNSLNPCYITLYIILQITITFESSCEPYRNRKRNNQSLAAVMSSQINGVLVHAAHRLWDWWSLIWCPPTALNITRRPHHLPTAISLFWMWTRAAQSLKSDSVQPFWVNRCDSKKIENKTTLHLAHSCYHRWTCARSLVLSLGEWRAVPWPSGPVLSPWRVQSQVYVSPAITIKK